MRTPKLPQLGIFTTLSLTEAFRLDLEKRLQAIIGQNCKSQHDQPGYHKLVRYRVQVLVLLRNSLQGCSDEYSDGPCHKE